MSGERHYDVVVIGSGIVGCTSAFWLARRGVHVALLARARCLIPALAGEAWLERCRTGIGVRPYPRDGKTLAGALPGSQGL